MKRLKVRWFITASVAVLITSCTADAPTPQAAPCSQPPAATGEFPERSAIPRETLPFPAPKTSDLSPAKQEALQSALKKFVDNDGRFIPLKGAMAAVVTPDGGWAGAAGSDGGGQPLLPESAAPIASITKTVTAAEVMFLADKGLVDLDKPASAYVDDPLLQRGATVRQLLAHTGGLPDIFESPEYERSVRADTARQWTPTEVVRLATEPIGEQGTFRYSNPGYALLGLVIEKVTGLSYAQALRRDVLSCLHNRLFVQTAETPTPPIVTADPVVGATSDGKYVLNRSFASAAGAFGGIAADARAVAQWGYQLYGGWVLPANRTMEMAVQVTSNYGLGTFIFSRVGHPGGYFGYTSYLAVSPQQKQSIAILIAGDVSPDAIDSLVARLDDAAR